MTGMGVRVSKNSRRKAEKEKASVVGTRSREDFRVSGARRSQAVRRKMTVPSNFIQSSSFKTFSSQFGAARQKYVSYSFPVSCANDARSEKWQQLLEFSGAIHHLLFLLRERESHRHKRKRTASMAMVVAEVAAVATTTATLHRWGTVLFRLLCLYF